MPLTDLHRPPESVGRSKADLRKLKRVGYESHSPPLVREAPSGGYIILDGQRRVMLANEEGLESIPVLVFEPRDEAHRLAVMLATGSTAVPRDLFECADVLDRLIATDPRLVSPRELERRIGSSHTYWARANRIRRLPEAIRELGRRKSLGSHDALRLDKIQSEDEQVRLAEARANKTLATAAQFAAAVEEAEVPDPDARMERAFSSAFSRMVRTYERASAPVKASMLGRVQDFLDESRPEHETDGSVR